MLILISDILKLLTDLALAEGLSAPRITSAHLPPVAGDRLEAFLNARHHGDMQWLEDRTLQRKSPDALWPQAKTAIVFAQSYAPDFDPMQRLEQRETGVISVYALNRDYHDVFKGKLKRLAHWLHQHTNEDVKIFVDTAPVMEKPLAAQAGLGWQGKHTNLVSRELGSWFFIGIILTTAEMPHDETENDHCGSCTACLDVCPTKAFPAARQLDARRCISYLTIEFKGHIPEEFRKPMGNRIYGCDDCLAVCPWNKFAEVGREAKLQARDDLRDPPLSKLLELDDAGFRMLFSGSPVKRTGRNSFIRNCLIAAGNSGDVKLQLHITPLLKDTSPQVRAMAVWALRQLMTEAEFHHMRNECVAQEMDNDVLNEWQKPQPT
jgi:epoxyqueuosine reductase